MPTHADHLRTEATRVRAEAAQVENENVSDELAEIALDYDLLAKRVDRLDTAVRDHLISNPN